MKSKKKTELISSTELEINGEKIMIGFQSQKNQINAVKFLEKELFKKKQAIIKINNNNKVMSVDDIEMFLISQAMVTIQHEVSIVVLNAFSSAYNRFKNWEDSQ